MSVGERSIAWTDQAKADLRAVDQSTALRLRVGDYRVRFCDYGDSILVLSVKHRHEAYR